MVVGGAGVVVLGVVVLGGGGGGGGLHTSVGQKVNTKCRQIFENLSQLSCLLKDMNMIVTKWKVDLKPIG